MITIISSLYKSERYLQKFIKEITKTSGVLTSHSIEHEFILLPNDPSLQELSLIDALCSSNTHIRKEVRSRESIYSTWNWGITVATYNAVTFWNVDDVRFAPALENGLKALDNGADVVYFPFIYKRYVRILGISILAKVKKIIPPEFDMGVFSTQMHAGPFFMVKKSVFKKIGLFNPTFKIAGDFDWITRAAKNNLVFNKGNEIAGIFTNDGTTLSGTKNILQQEENQRILKQ